MDLKHMRHFVAVAEELHFGKAARRLNIAQPPLSQSIRRLEESLSVELFDRGRRNVALTPAGQAFLVEARRTLVQAELARTLAKRAAAKTEEVLVSFIGPALYQVLPALLVRFRAALPDVNVRLFERASADQVAGIIAGHFDIGFVPAGSQRPVGWETMLVERAPIVAAIPADWPMALQPSVSLTELARQPFILPPQRHATQVSETLEMFERVGAHPHVTQEASQTNTTISLVGAGLGCSLVMATATLTAWRNVRFVQISEKVAPIVWELAMVWDPARLGGIQAGLVRITRDYVRENPQLLDPSKLLGA